MDLATKIKNAEKLSFDEALSLYDLDIHSLGALASQIRQKKHAKKVFFNINRHINPSNFCADICKFCAFSAHRKNENSYTMSKDEIIKIAENTANSVATELHIVSAHHPKLAPEFYLDIFKEIKTRFPHLHIKAMTAAEVDYWKRKFGWDYEKSLNAMIENGVDSMPGGGAEIFDEVIRRELCDGKVSSENWLKIHFLWHGLGRQSNATMLIGHIENRAHRIDHMFRIRDLQDKSLKSGDGGGFNAFIPLIYQTQNNYLQNIQPLSALEYLKTIAIARILLDNVAHIKAYWASASLNLAILAQEYGADDLDGTIENEMIQSAAGAASKSGKTKSEFIELIQTAGFTPVQRGSLYNEIEIYKD